MQCPILNSSDLCKDSPLKGISAPCSPIFEFICDADRGSLPPTREEGRYTVPDSMHSSRGDKVLFKEIF